MSSPLEFASNEQKADKELVLLAVSYYGLALGFASNELKADKEVVLAAVANCGHALCHASYKLRADKDVVLAAMKNAGTLEYASPNFSADKDVVLVAVKTAGSALFCASDELKADKEVVLVAVAKYGGALKYASKELKIDKDVVLVAVAQNSIALHFLSDYQISYFRSWIQEFILARRSILILNCASKPRYSPNDCVLFKLNSHGPHFAVVLKRHIASFVGVPDKSDWRVPEIVCGAYGPSWALINTACANLKLFELSKS